MCTVTRVFSVVLWPWSLGAEDGNACESPTWLSPLALCLPVLEELAVWRALQPEMCWRALLVRVPLSRMICLNEFPD